MMCLFLNTQTKSMEEFKKSVRAQNKIFIGLGLLGLFTLSASLVASFTPYLSISERAKGFLCGFGSSIIVISILLLIRNRKLLNDEAKLKEERLKMNDERNIMVNTLALKNACLILVAFLYIALIVGIFISRAMSICLFMSIMVFFIAYLGFRHYFSKHN